MTSYQVTFLPDQKTARIEQGASIAEAAQKAGVFINNLCGGEGLCGACRVQIIKGQAVVDAQSSALLSKQEIEKGFRLACQTRVEQDLEISIPIESRLAKAQIMTGGFEPAKTREDQPGGTISSFQPPTFPLKPLVQKVYLQLEPPTLEDNITDLERVFRELKRRFKGTNYDISLTSLLDLSNTLRNSHWKITASIVKDKDRYRIQQIEPLDTTDRHYGLAIDIGTTTVVAQLVDLKTNQVLGVEGTLNLQAQYGEDVISRIIYACNKGGLTPLHQSIINDINQLIEQLTHTTGIEREAISMIVAAGNTTMSHLLLNLTPCSIRLEPYIPTADIYPQVLAKEIGIHIHDQGTLETISSVASYVGGDIVAGVLACGISEHEEIQGLIDIGTNGEIAIGNKDWLVCCSASAGPAFEGGGTSCGMRAISGAIEAIRIQDHKVFYKTVAGARPRGICGSGLIDCIYEFVKNKIIGSDGKMNLDDQDPRLVVKDGVPHYIIAWPQETETGQALMVSEADIANLMKSKGAVFAAIKSLLDYIGLSFDQLERFYVAGGFGNYLNITKAVAIGLLPDMPREKIVFIGNSSLTGARLALVSEEAFERSLHIAKSMTNIELSNYQPFMDEYVAALFLPHTDRKLFPSVDY